jgi:3-oxoacyl-[acyl-carrier-protein] synthase-3
MGNVFRGFGSYIPEIEVDNKDFHDCTFYDEHNQLINADSNEITDKFEKITGIQKRRYVSHELLTSDIGILASKEAIKDAGIDPEDIDQIIVAHNFGNIRQGDIQSEFMPCLAAKIKQGLGIKNPKTVAYDVIFGCPGWVQGVIQADCFIKSGIAKNILIVGCETLSRVLDPFDRDSMIFSDGAGACILSSSESTTEGILSFSTVTHAIEEADYLYCGVSNKIGEDRTKYIKMKGRKIYEYAISQVPDAIKDALDKTQYSIRDVKKVFIHQANEKMDEAIIKLLFKRYDEQEIPEHIMPMSIHELGNSSVATVPTLMDLVLKNKMEHHKIEKGDLVILASVGAGMHINAIVYKF